MTMRDVGGLGHKDFEKLCDMVGLIHNSSYNKDAAGWDVIVEFPLNPRLNILNKCDSQAIQCFVQVKATDKKTKSVQVKLSNLKRFCDTPLPCFFFFAEYQGGLNPVSIYLVHFDKSKTFDVLKRLRECELAGNTKLNKKTMLIKYDDSHKLNSIDGFALKECIESHVCSGMGEYAKYKTELLDTLGYDKFKFKMAFKLDGDSDYKSLIEASLGYEKSVNIKDISGWDQRFGIDLEISELSTKTAIVSFGDVKPHSHGTIEFNDGSERVIFDCDYYFSDIALNAPHELASFRVKCKYFDLLIGTKNNTSKIDFSGYEHEMTVYDLRDVTLLVKILSDCQSIVEISLRNEDGRETNITTRSPLNLDKKTIELTEEILSIVSQLIRIAGYFRSENLFKLKLNDLLKKEEDIRMLHDFIFDPSNKMVLKLKIPELRETLDNTRKFYVLLGLPLIFPKFSLALTLLVNGDFIQIPEGVIFNNYKVDIKSKLSESNFDLLKAKLRTAAFRISEEMDSMDDVYFVDSLSSKLN